MRHLRTIIYAGLTLAWIAFALWQYRNYQQQAYLIEASLRQQSRSIMTALVGGLASHRRLGQFFEDQLQGMLDELVKSDDVVFVAIRTSQGEDFLSAGDAHSSQYDSADSRRPSHDPAGTNYYRQVRSFKLSGPPGGPHGMGGGGGGPGRGGMGGGGMGGGGMGRGMGLGSRRWSDGAGSMRPGPLGMGDEFTAELVLDRSRADQLTVRMAWSHAWVVVAAGVVALSIGLLWRTTMNLAEAKGQTRVFEAETRHLRELSQAAAGLAHETRNPLGLIRGWTQRLAETSLPEAEQQEHWRAIVEECDRVTARINQFLAFARPHAPEITSVDIAQLLDELTVILQPDLETRQLAIECHVTAEIGRLQADSELLRQVVFNLLQNAVYFSPKSGTIDVMVKRRGTQRAVLQIADRGPGVKKEEVESLFTPYFTTRPDGTGLGLAIVRHIATLHDWEVTYRARADGGAIFEIGNMHVTN